MLAKRLAKHGLAVVGGGLVLSQNAALAAVPKILTDGTIKAASLLGAGQNVVGVASPGAIALSEGVGRVMLVSKCKMLVTALFGLLFCTCWIINSRAAASWR